MTFEQARAAALTLLTAQGRVKNSELLAVLGGDQTLLARVREDLIFNDLAKDKDGVGLIAVAPTPAVAAATPATKPRVFLSYGRRDASAFVDRLCVDLAAAGFDVWRDTREIRSGQDWQTEIVDGLRAAQVVVAVLTPHSVRTTRDANTSDQVDSVCLGEIAYALFQPPPQPVVPVMAQTCEPPLAIFHLDYIDLRAWQDSDEQYRAGLQRLIDGIHAALRGEKRYRAWHHQLNPFDFASFLHPKRADFRGRQWLFDKLDAWRAASGRERALLIKGDPGVGKSAIVAELVHRNPDGQVLAYHCCQWDHGETLNPSRFVRSLAAMIASKVEAYADLLQHNPTLRDALSESACETDAGSALEAGLFAPLERLPAPEGGPRYLLIDALDEALLAPSGSANIVHLLASRLSRLPGWLRVVATTRKDPLVLSHLAGLRAEEIDTQSADNRDDLRLFLDEQPATPNLSEVLTHTRLAPAQVRDELLVRSDGNFLYVRQALEALELRQLDPRQLDQLPPGMGGLYAHRFARLFPNDADFAGPKRVFEALSAAQEPLNATQLAAITELDEDDALPALLTKLATYVPPRPAADGEVRYSFYHKSLSDWLTATDRRGQPHSVNPKSGHRRLADLGWSEYRKMAALGRPASTSQKGTAEGGHPTLSPYTLRHLPTHLLETERWDDVSQLLTDLSYLEAKTTTGHAFELAMDFTRATTRLPQQHAYKRLLALLDEALRRDLHFIARHAEDYPQALFQCLWNTAWWYDCPDASQHYVAPERGGKPPPHWQHEGLKLCDLLTRWRAVRGSTHPGFVWLCTLRPPSIHLGTAQRAVLRGHEAHVSSVSYSPDGTRIVSGSEDNTLRVWDAASGEELAVLRGDIRDVLSVSYSPDGMRIVSGSGDKKLRVWDAASGEELAVLRGHESGVTSVSYSPDGTRIVTGSDDRILRVWDIARGVVLSALRGHEGVVNTVSYSSDGTRIVSGSDDQTLRVWDAVSGEDHLLVLRGHTGWVKSVSYSPDGTRIVSGSDDQTVRVWDAVRGIELLVLYGHKGWVKSVSYSPDGTRIVSGSWDRTLRIWDALSGVELSVLSGHEGAVTSVSYSPDGTRIVGGALDKTLRVWDALNGAEMAVLRGHDGDLNGVGYLLDGKRILSRSEDNTFRLWDAVSGTELAVLHGHHRRKSPVSFSPDGTRFAIGTSEDVLEVWDATSGMELAVLRGCGINSWNAKFSPNGMQIVSAAPDYKLCLWNVEGGVKVSVMRGHEGDIMDATFSPDGMRIVSGSSDETLRVWRVESGEEIAMLRGLEDVVLRVSYSLDGARIIAESVLNNKRMWDAEAFNLLEGIPGSNETSDVDSTLISSRNQTCHAVDRDLEMIVQSTATGRTVARFPEQRAYLTASPCGRAWVGGLGRHLQVIQLEGSTD